MEQMLLCSILSICWFAYLINSLWFTGRFHVFGFFGKCCIVTSLHQVVTNPLFWVYWLWVGWVFLLFSLADSVLFTGSTCSLWNSCDLISCFKIHIHWTKKSYSLEGKRKSLTLTVYIWGYIYIWQMSPWLTLLCGIFS